jgi:heat shock protein HslJ
MNNLPVVLLTALLCGAPIPVMAANLLNMPEGPLSDTEWRLVSFTPSNAAEASFSPPKGAKYTMVLKTKGRVTFRYDCNTARGIWSSVNPADGRDTLTFGPLAMTHKACESTAFNKRISGDIRETLGYSLDGALLTVRTASGIYLWHRLD